MNHVDLVGRTTKEIEISYTPNKQTAVCRFTIAVDRRGAEGADFISCKAWGKTAENMNKYVKKGQRVAVSGRLETGSYKNDQGVTVYTTDVVADAVEFL